MEYKYVIILFDEDGKVYRVVRVKNKRNLRDRVSYEVEAYPHICVVTIGIFNHSDNAIIKRARKCKNIVDF